MNSKEPKFVICIQNDDCEDLELRKVFQVIPDKQATKDGYLRIVDETGEDYLYPESYFSIVKLARKAQSVLAIAK